MSRPLALLWLVLTVAPVVYFFCMIFYFPSVSSHNQSFEDAKAQFDLFFRLQLIVILGSWSLIASYIIYLFRTSYVPEGKRALWAAVLFLGNIFAMPIFWYLYVWRPLQSESTGA